MEQDLISKRELLEKYGISYGALYRWKRMGLIPEDWFLRRSTRAGDLFLSGAGLPADRTDPVAAGLAGQSGEGI